MRKIRVLIVDDSTVIRRLLSDILSEDAEIEIAGTAANGKIALCKIPQVSPDVVTLDMEMPEMDGLATLKELRNLYPALPVIMFSTLTSLGATSTLDALTLGANDYVTKPANVGSVMAAMQSVRSELIPKIKALCRWHAAANKLPSPVRAANHDGPKSALPVSSSTRRVARIDIVTIGVSTGGPNALAKVLPQLPGDFPVPIVIVQHMPPIFTKHLAHRLDQASPLEIVEAKSGDELRPGTVWIAPGDYHMTIHRDGARVFIDTDQDPQENSCRPAVDKLFRSVASTYGAHVLACVLTGMGQDGKKGCETIHQSGGIILAQDESSSVVWGMPRAVVHAGLADFVEPLEAIATKIESLCRRVPARTHSLRPLEATQHGD